MYLNTHWNTGFFFSLSLSVSSSWSAARSMSSPAIVTAALHCWINLHGDGSGDSTGVSGLSTNILDSLLSAGDCKMNKRTYFGFNLMFIVEESNLWFRKIWSKSVSASIRSEWPHFFSKWVGVMFNFVYLLYRMAIEWQFSAAERYPDNSLLVLFFDWTFLNWFMLCTVTKNPLFHEMKTIQPKIMHASAITI